MTLRRKALAAAAATTASLAFAASASAADIAVNTTADEYLTNPSACSLREATISANFNDSGGHGCVDGTVGDDTITFSLPPDSEISLSTADNGELLITESLTITGPGMDDLTVIAPPPNDRVIESTGGVPLTISGLSITGGNITEVVEAHGGGISAGGTLSLTDVAVTGNSVTVTDDGGDADASAGGVYGSGTVTVNSSVISGNTATAENSAAASAAQDDVHATGGGVFGATVTITDSTISGNTVSGTDEHGNTIGEGAHVQGGGIASPGLTLRRSTVSGNHVAATAPEGGESAWGGGVFSNGTGSIIELSTIAGNTVGAAGGGAGQMGGGIINFGSLTLQSATVAGNGPASGSMTSANLKPNDGALEVGITLKNTIVASPLGVGSTNCPAAPPVDDPVISSGFNIDDGTSCGLDQGSDQESTDPMLDPDGLEDNGGPTETIRLLSGSLAIDGGSATGQADATHDQRGLSRPNDAIGFDNADDGSDVGAFEAQPPASPTLTGTNPVSPSATDTTPQVQGATDAGTGPESATDVAIYTDSGCTTQVNANSPATFATPGINGGIVANSARTFYATTSNAYGITSACSSTLSSNGSITYTHDSLSPVLTIDSGPSGSTTNHIATFTFHGTDLSPPVAYMCSLDTGTPAFSPCTSPFTSASLPDGSYTFRVSAQDSLLNPTSTAIQAFTVTTPAPPVATVPKKCKKGQKLKKGKCVKKKKRKK